VLDPQDLYYTLSTVAQALAGALAVFVAFVLFRLAHLDQDVLVALSDLQGKHSGWEKFWKALRDGGLPKLDETLNPPEGDSRTRAQYSVASIAWRQRRHIVPVLYGAVIASVVDIAACFIMLPSTHTLARSSWAVYAAFGVVGLGVLCLASYVLLIAVAVKSPEPSHGKESGASPPR